MGQIVIDCAHCARFSNILVSYGHELRTDPGRCIYYQNGTYVTHNCAHYKFEVLVEYKDSWFSGRVRSVKIVVRSSTPAWCWGTKTKTYRGVFSHDKGDILIKRVMF